MTPSSEASRGEVGPTGKEARPHFVRRTFLAGLLILLPLFVTYLLVGFLLGLFAGVGGPLATGLLRALGLDQRTWLEPLVPLVELALTVAVIFLLGLFGTNILGRRVLVAFEGLLMRLPVVRSVYGAAKQMVDTFHGPGQSFQRVVMVQYPSKGLWVMGFVACEHRDALQLTPADRLLAVFVPTTPNPTSGFLVMVSPEDVVDVDYSVEDAFKFIVSSGIVGKALVPPLAPAPRTS
jgi:uncharacterized membrane protein